MSFSEIVQSISDSTQFSPEIVQYLEGVASELIQTTNSIERDPNIINGLLLLALNKNSSYSEVAKQFAFPNAPDFNRDRFQKTIKEEADYEKNKAMKASGDTITINIGDTLDVTQYSNLDGSVLAIPHGFGDGESFTIHVPDSIDGRPVNINSISMTDGVSNSTYSEQNFDGTQPGTYSVSGGYNDGPGTFSYTFEVVSIPVIEDEVISVPDGGTYTVELPSDYSERFSFIVRQKWDGSEWVGQHVGFSKIFEPGDEGPWRIVGAAIQNFGIVGYDYFSVESSVGVDAVDEDEGLKLYPNPAVNHIKLGEYEGNVVIVDVNGEVIYNDLVEKGQSIDVSDFPVGTYFLTTESGKLSKFMKMK